VQLDNKEFEKKTGTGIWLVHFSIPYSGFCKRLSNSLSELSVSKFIKVNIGVVDSVKYSSLAEHYGLSSFPSLILFRDGRQYFYNKKTFSVPDLLDFINKSYKTSKSTVMTHHIHDEL